MSLNKTKIEIRRTKRGISRKELADLVGVTERAIEYYEKGKREPKASILKKIAEVFGCLMEDLI